MLAVVVVRGAITGSRWLRSLALFRDVRFRIHRRHLASRSTLA